MGQTGAADRWGNPRGEIPDGKATKSQPHNQSWLFPRRTGLTKEATTRPLRGIYKPCSWICTILFFGLPQYDVAAGAASLNRNYPIAVQEGLNKFKRAIMVCGIGA